MNKHPDCANECQQAVDYGVWPEHSCSPECVRLTDSAKLMSDEEFTATVRGLGPVLGPDSPDSFTTPAIRKG